MNNKQDFRNYAVKHRRIGGAHVDKYISRIEDVKVPQMPYYRPSQISGPVGITPYIIEERPMNVASMDVFSRLMMDRIIFLGDPIYDMTANIVQAQLLFLQSTDATRDISLYLNSPGGSVYAGLGIYDTMQFVKPDVATICTGIAASMAAVLLCAGAKGKRAVLPHSRVMIHQPSGGAEGQASDIEITAREIAKTKKELYEIIASHSGQEYQRVWDASDRDHWMNATEAKEFGMVDEILAASTRQ